MKTRHVVTMIALQSCVLALMFAGIWLLVPNRATAMLPPTEQDALDAIEYAEGAKLDFEVTYAEVEAAYNSADAHYYQTMHNAGLVVDQMTAEDYSLFCLFTYSAADLLHDAQAESQEYSLVTNTNNAYGALSSAYTYLNQMDWGNAKLSANGAQSIFISSRGMFDVPIRALIGAAEVDLNSADQVLANYLP